MQGTFETKWQFVMLSTGIVQEMPIQVSYYYTHPEPEVGYAGEFELMGIKIPFATEEENRQAFQYLEQGVKDHIIEIIHNQSRRSAYG